MRKLIINSVNKSNKKLNALGKKKKLFGLKKFINMPKNLLSLSASLQRARWTCWLLEKQNLGKSLEASLHKVLEIKNTIIVDMAFYSLKTYNRYTV
jgi:hypothetical protein